MNQIVNNNRYDLEERTFMFAINCRNLIRSLSKTIQNSEDSKQLVRSSGSVAANYIEANESLSKKDFLLRVKICKKEAKESRLWLKLLSVYDNEKLNIDRNKLIDESLELMKIFGSIIEKSK